MAVLTENIPHALGFVMTDEGSISYDRITLVSGAGALKAGTVLGKITASGKYQAYDNDASDGSEVAAAILTHAQDATSADIPAAALTRMAQVNGNLLIWGAGVTTQGEKDAAIADLAAKTVIVR